VESYVETSIFAWLRRQSSQGPQIGCVCAGCYILARVGWLKGYRCTIRWYNLPGLVEEFDDLEVTPDLYTIDRDSFTCAGGAAATDMMLDLIRGPPRYPVRRVDIRAHAYR